MSAFPSRRPNHAHAAAGLRRITAALAAVAGGVLAWAAAVPAASASIIPVPADGPYGPAPAPAVRVITAGGMPGWQVALIAVCAAVAAAAAAVRLDRTLTAGRAGLMIATWRSCLARAQHRPLARPARRPGAGPACQAASAQDTSLPNTAPAPGTPDTVEFGRSPTR
jgi:hypothetical protein